MTEPRRDLISLSDKILAMLGRIGLANPKSTTKHGTVHECAG
jgi:hypothetical protein